MPNRVNPHLQTARAHSTYGAGKNHGYGANNTAPSYFRKVLAGWLPHGARVLDVGGGVGDQAAFLHENAGATVVVSEVSISALDAARPHATGEAAVAEEVRRLFETDAFESATQRQELSFLATRFGAMVVSNDGMYGLFGSGTFDAIHSKDVLPHLPDKGQFFSESFRLLRPGGQWRRSSRMFSRKQPPRASWSKQSATGDRKTARPTG